MRKFVNLLTKGLWSSPVIPVSSTILQQITLMKLKSFHVGIKHNLLYSVSHYYNFPLKIHFNMFSTIETSLISLANLNRKKRACRLSCKMEICFITHFMEFSISSAINYYSGVLKSWFILYFLADGRKVQQRKNTFRTTRWTF